MPSTLKPEPGKPRMLSLIHIFLPTGHMKVSDSGMRSDFVTKLKNLPQMVNRELWSCASFATRPDRDRVGPLASDSLF